MNTEIKSATEILGKYISNDDLSNEYDIYKAMEEYASQFKEVKSNDVGDVEKAALKLNAACDAMWNSYGISNKLPDHFVKHINQAQKELKNAIENQQSINDKKEVESNWNEVIDEVLKHNAVNWHNLIPTLKKEFYIKRKG